MKKYDSLVLDRFFSDPCTLPIWGKLDMLRRLPILRFGRYLLAAELTGIETLTPKDYDRLEGPAKIALDLWSMSVLDKVI